MLAVASGKGGVGKTWLSVTLAQALARSGKRVLLFDGDLGLANVDIQLGLQPRNDLGGVLDGSYALKDAVAAYPGGGFDVIAGRSGTGSLANISAARLQQLMAALVALRSEEHTSELQSLMRIAYAVFCLQKKKSQKCTP